MGARARIVVIGNEKSGTGKSTVAMQLIVALIGLGARVGSIDLDARQASLTRFLENRRLQGSQERLMPTSIHEAVAPGADEGQFLDAVGRLSKSADIIVVDTPGQDAPASRAAHAYADLLVSPVNDRFSDLDVLARIDPGTLRISQPSHYAEMVWEARKSRARRGEYPADWFVVRNRLALGDLHNQHQMERLLGGLSKRIGFRLIAGLGDRPIYRDIFMDGLTLLDFGKDSGLAMKMPHVAARQELRRLVAALRLPALVNNTLGTGAAEIKVTT